MITNIKREFLFPHPDNVRREVGDVTELADSIKQNGIFQNLTVVRGGKGVPEGKEGYTVIIGHRRLAAATLAGIDELPCSIVEMSEQEQISTMLLENMQRSDLTAYEQAQGFQMMLDFGETKQSIAEKTGFSQATVSKRLKLLVLDNDGFKAAEERGGTLEQYLQVAELTDEEDRDKALKKIGTDDFRWFMTGAKKRQKIAELTPLIKNEVKAFAKEGETSWRWNGDYDVVKRMEIVEWTEGALVPDSIPGSTEYWYIIDVSSGWVYIVKKAEKKKAAPKRKSPKEKYADELREQLDRITHAMYDSRRLFVEGFTASKKYQDKLYEWTMKFIAQRAITDHARIYYTTQWLAKHLHTKKNVFTPEAFENHDPANLPLALIWARVIGDYEDFCYADRNWGETFPKHRENSYLTMIYDFLCDIGYTLSEEERQMMDGTHPVFESEEV